MIPRSDRLAGVVLFTAAAVALIWANVAPGSYTEVWSAAMTLPGPGHALTLQSWVNDGLMAVFFFVIGLEIKREVVAGDLRDPRTAIVPIAAAIGGMVIPAAIFAVVTAGTSGGHAWGIPMATDIAVAIGVLRLVGSRVPQGLGLMLLTLAIVDDLGAIIVIAVFYSTNISLGWLLAAGVVLIGIVGLRRFAHHPVLFVLPAIAAWICVYRSGVHATIAGVLLAFCTPLRSRSGRSVLRALENRLAPWTMFLVLPVFALANAGIVLSADHVQAAATSALGIGIVAGLIVGKLFGITGGIWLATRIGGRLPEGVGTRAVITLGLLGGIGFTVSLFIAGLALSGRELEIAKLAVMGASAIAAVCSSAMLMTIRPAAPTRP